LQTLTQVVFCNVRSLQMQCTSKHELFIHVTVHQIAFFLNNQQDALLTQIYSVIKLYMFLAYSLLIIRSFLLYIRRW